MLYDIQNDLQNNIKIIEDGIVVLDKGMKHSNAILSTFGKQTKYDTIMNTDFQFYTYYWDSDFRTGSFENLKKEEHNLIANDSLRNKIIDLFEINMDIFNVSDLNRNNDYMTSVGNQMLTKHIYLDRKSGYILPKFVG